MRLADALLLLYEKGDCATHVAVSGVAGRPLSFSASVWGPPHSVRVVWAPEHTAGHRHAGFRGERVVSGMYNNTGL